MLEILQGGESEWGVVSNLGPGPTVLIGGDFTAGFFGECTTLDLITGPALATAIGLIVGTAFNSTEQWLKFIIDGKIVYYAKKPFRHSVAWSQLNAIGVVYGSRTIVIGNNSFAVSLPLGRNPDTGIAYAPGYDVKSTWNSEWNRLLYPVTVATATNPKNSQVGPNWANYTEAELLLKNGGGLAAYSWCQEAGSIATNLVCRAANGVSWITAAGGNQGGASYGWRPVLRLVQ